MYSSARRDPGRGGRGSATCHSCNVPPGEGRVEGGGGSWGKMGSNFPGVCATLVQTHPQHHRKENNGPKMQGKTQAGKESDGPSSAARSPLP